MPAADRAALEEEGRTPSSKMTLGGRVLNRKRGDKRVFKVVKGISEKKGSLRHRSILRPRKKRIRKPHRLGKKRREKKKRIEREKKEKPSCFLS